MNVVLSTQSCWTSRLANASNCQTCQRLNGVSLEASLVTFLLSLGDIEIKKSFKLARMPSSLLPAI